MAQKIKKGDRVYVRCGASKGLIGLVKEILKKSNRAVVEGVKTLKRHRRGSASQLGGKEDIPVSISLPNLYPVAPSGAYGRVGFMLRENGKKVRVLKRTGEMFDE